MANNSYFASLEKEIDDLLASINVEELPDMTDAEMDAMLDEINNSNIISPMTQEEIDSLSEEELDNLLENMLGPAISDSKGPVQQEALLPTDIDSLSENEINTRLRAKLGPAKEISGNKIIVKK